MSKSIVLAAIRTTGLKITQDRITEIALSRYHADGERECRSIIIPSTSPETGLIFSAAQTLADWCADSILLAWNVRLTHSFLKNHLRGQGLALQCKQLNWDALTLHFCPESPPQSLEDLKAFLNWNEPLQQAIDERDLLDAYLLYLFRRFERGTVLDAINHLAKRRSSPPKLKTDMSTIPNTPGVYLFYGEHSELPIYIGKSIRLRQRILSHFQQEHCSEKEFKMAQQVNSIEWIETPGELSALLLESRLIKEQLPLYNQKLRRKKRIVGYQFKANADYLTLHISTQMVMENTEDDNLLGAFSSVHAAKRHLEQLVKTYRLCPKLCGLEKTNSTCFSFQLGRCQGACNGEEEPSVYNARVNEAFSLFKKETWPFPGSIAIKEQYLNRQHWLLFNQWRYLGTIDNEQDLTVFEANMQCAEWDRDSYRILKQFLKEERSPDEVVIL
ncbi:GIY-YIG nuclease family protein [Legionella quinlivanii]|uniref:GIY-YIG nuclease family protein n=1 Tax=Legionella quinlivanii TaxID=45073 RepID=UPI002244199F|nr:GIY-YIG nuclease family protein [Legionella quinlivanii]MCW8452598.1 GIY-YIG nuclease family protein [Legionella quinlivanii]